MKKEPFDANNMSKKTGISGVTIVTTLGQEIPNTCTATTFEDALSQAEVAVLGSLAEYFAVTKALEFTTTYDQAKKVLDTLGSGTEVEKLAYEKTVSLAETTDELEELYKYESPGLEELKTTAFKKWLTACTNFDEAQAAYGATPNNSEEEKMAISRQIALITTIDSITNLYNDEENPDLKKEAGDRWNTLSMAALSTAETIEDVKEVCTNAMPSSATKTAAAEKLAGLVTTFEEAEECISYCWSDNEPNADLRPLVDKAITFADGAKDLKDLYSMVNTSKTLMAVVVEKWNEVSTEAVNTAFTEAELIEAYNNAPVNSEAAKVAIEKLATEYYEFEKETAGVE
jgi:hypothetical protein